VRFICFSHLEKVMKFFQKFASLTAAGVVFHVTMRAAGENMQLELLPVADPGKTGIALLPRTFVGTAEELDRDIPEFLDGYLINTSNLREQMDAANVAMKKAEDDAKAAVAKASEAKPAASSKSNSSPTKTLSKTVPGLENKRASLDDGLIGDGDGDDDGKAGVTESTGGSSAKQDVSDGGQAAGIDTHTANLFV
jgi:PRTRC genetic system protein E